MKMKNAETPEASEQHKNKIGLYFGTFNPIHIGHLVIANHLAENSALDKVWFVVTPLSPFKKKTVSFR